MFAYCHATAFRQKDPTAHKCAPKRNNRKKQKQAPPNTSTMADHAVGSKISLISKSEIRYEGYLHFINAEENTVGLRNVRMFGTEGRKGDPKAEIPPGEQLYEFIIFRGADIKDLTVYEWQPQDPAIVSATPARGAQGAGGAPAPPPPPSRGPQGHAQQANVPPQRGAPGSVYDQPRPQQHINPNDFRNDHRFDRREDPRSGAAGAPQRGGYGNQGGNSNYNNNHHQGGNDRYHDRRDDRFHERRDDRRDQGGYNNNNNNHRGGNDNAPRRDDRQGGYNNNNNQGGNRGGYERRDNYGGHNNNNHGGNNNRGGMQGNNNRRDGGGYANRRDEETFGSAATAPRRDNHRDNNNNQRRDDHGAGRGHGGDHRGGHRDNHRDNHDGGFDRPRQPRVESHTGQDFLPSTDGKEKEAFKEDFDFKKAADEFAKRREGKPEEAAAVAEAAGAYKKVSSFFDNISCETKQRLAQKEKPDARVEREAQTKVDTDTFGAEMVAGMRGFRHNRRGGRGRQAGGGFSGNR